MALDPDEVAVDRDALARSRIVLQYQNAAKLLAFVDLLMAPLQEIEDCLVQIPGLDAVATAGGVNLDVTAELVGQSRGLLDGTSATDTVLRGLTNLRIARNNSDATAPEFIAAVFGLLATTVTLFDLGAMAAYYQIARAPTADERAILNQGEGSLTVLPKPMGVQIFQIWYLAANSFGWAEDPDPNTLGFSEVSAPTTGGQFAEDF